MKFKPNQVVFVDNVEYNVVDTIEDKEWEDPIYILESNGNTIHEYESNIEEKQNGLFN